MRSSTTMNDATQTEHHQLSISYDNTQQPFYKEIFIHFFFFFNHTAPPEIYTSVHTLSLHDALPISARRRPGSRSLRLQPGRTRPDVDLERRSEEHTSELQSRTLISYAVFCLKK